MAEVDPGHDGTGKKNVSTTRVVIWVVAGATGAYLVLSGIFGIVAKG
jgi:hypothetical protein